MFRPRRGAYDDRSAYGNFWFEPVGNRSMSGMRVSADTAMRLGVVYRCVQVLSNTLAMLPFGLFLPGRNGVRKPQPGHWLYKLLATAPNLYQNPYEWRQMCMGHIALRGNCFNLITANGRGEVTALTPMHPDRMSVDVFPNGSYRYLYREMDGSNTPYARGRIWHVRGLSEDGIMGISPIRHARDAIGGGLAAQEWGALYFKNAGVPTGGWIGLAAKMKKEDRDDFVEQWQNARQGENRHRTPILDQGMTFNELAVRNDEAQFIDTRKFSVTDICRFFGVPPHLAYDLERSTNNNIEQQSLEFLVFTMTSVAVMWEAAIKFEFLSDDETGLDPSFDMSPLTRADTAGRSAYYKTMWQLAAFSPNDVLKAEGKNPVVGGNQRFVPVNYTPLVPNMPPSSAMPAGAADDDDDDDDQDEDKDGAEGDDDAPEPKPGKPKSPQPDKPKPPKKRKGTEARLMQLSSAAAERIARREVAVIQKAVPSGAAAIARAYELHARFVSDALGVPMGRAVSYCDERVKSLQPDQDFAEYETISRGRLERLASEGSL